MASEFTLTKKSADALPETVEVDGGAFHIDASFRNILAILRMTQDDDIIEWHKTALLCKWFYGDSVPRDTDATIQAFMRFLHRGDVPERNDDGKPPVFDYEIDAPEIYASFVALYGIDLLDSNMHWWKFCTLLDSAFRVECALSEKVKLRTVDASKCEEPGDVRRAQDAIRIETKQSRAEREAQDKLYEILTGGGDVSAKLEAFKNGV